LQIAIDVPREKNQERLAEPDVRRYFKECHWLERCTGTEKGFEHHHEDEAEENLSLNPAIAADRYCSSALNRALTSAW
jgi:hypothetical protein